MNVRYRRVLPGSCVVEQHNQTVVVTEDENINLTSPECILNFPLTSYIKLGLLSILHKGMRTAAFGMSESGNSLGFSDIVFCKAARINVKERLVKGAEREKWGEESRGNASDIVRRGKSSTTGSWVSGHAQVSFDSHKYSLTSSMAA